MRSAFALVSVLGHTPWVFFVRAWNPFRMLRLAEIEGREIGKSVEVLVDESVTRRWISMDVRLLVLSGRGGRLRGAITREVSIIVTRCQGVFTG
jgi:hypothetical protein